MSLAARPVLALMANALVYGVCWWPFRQLDAAGLHVLWATAIVYLGLTIVILSANRTAITRLLTQPGLLLLMTAAGLANASFNWGVVLGDVVRVVLLFYLMPVWAALAGRWLLGEKLTPVVIARIAGALTGAFLILYEPGTALPLPSGPADWLGLTGGFWFAMNNVLIRWQANEDPKVLALAMFVGGMVIPGSLAIALSLAGQVPWPKEPGTWSMLVVMLGVAFLFGNAMLIYGATRLPANIVSTILICEVLFAAISAYLIAGETINLRTAAGGALIIAACAAAGFWGHPESPKQSTR